MIAFQVKKARIFRSIYRSKMICHFQYAISNANQNKNKKIQNFRKNNLFSLKFLNRQSLLLYKKIL